MHSKLMYTLSLSQSRGERAMLRGCTRRRRRRDGALYSLSSRRGKGHSRIFRILMSSLLLLLLLLLHCRSRERRRSLSIGFFSFLRSTSLCAVCTCVYVCVCERERESAVSVLFRPFFACPPSGCSQLAAARSNARTRARCMHEGSRARRSGSAFSKIIMCAKITFLADVNR